MNQDHTHRSIEDRIEFGIDRATGVQARDEVARLTGDARERTADDHLVVGLDRQRRHAAVEAGVIRRVDGTVGVETRKVVVRGATDARERAANDHAAVCLRG